MRQERVEMSVSDSTESQTAASLSVTLMPGAAPVQVSAGTADVFAVMNSGVHSPVATINAGGTVFATDADIALIAVPRQGSRFSDNAATDAQAIADFIRAVQADLGQSANDLSATTVAELGSALRRVILAADAAAAAAWQLGVHNSITRSAELYDGSLSRIEVSTETLGAMNVALDDPPLIKVLRQIGDSEGFQVFAPSLSELRTTQDPLQLVCHKSGLRSRPVFLQPGWENLGTSSFLGGLVNPGQPPQPVALIRQGRGYTIQGPEDPTPRALDAQTLKSISPQAFELYAPLPNQRAVGVRDVIRMGLHGSGRLWIFVALMALAVAGLGLITPILTQIVVGLIIPQGSKTLLMQVGIALAMAALGVFAFTLVQNFTVSLISQRATLRMQSAFWDRVLSMPAGFFRKFNSGDLTVRVLAVNSLQALVSAQVVSAALAAVFGLVNLFLMFKYDVMLGIVGTIFLILSVLVLFLGVRGISRYATQALVETKKANGWVVQMLSGIMKIRIANAENRMEALYLDIARDQAVASARQTMVIGRISAWFVFSASGASALFYLVVLLSWNGEASVTSATYLAFTSAFSMAFAGVAGLSSLISPLANAGPTFNLLAPIMESLPESAGNRQDPGVLAGAIELCDVKFRYSDDSPLILQGLSIKVDPGSMVALVGPSGAGKSTVTRLLLGFETPEDGQILYDGRALKDLDLTLVRRQMGVVVQEGTILRSSVLKNIIGSVSHDIDAAWAAAASAAIADDIKAMPMGMETIVDPANISGGQAQRILLARALVNKPSILILDEATSALDNESQAIVTNAMMALNATRIVIAHRLSTIRSADRIIVIDKGVAVEQGTYDELMAMNGVFVKQVERQIS
jgi:NHLM bacteriocin system ABC transporter ATP-binding protein